MGSIRVRTVRGEHRRRCRGCGGTGRAVEPAIGRLVVLAGDLRRLSPSSAAVLEANLATVAGRLGVTLEGCRAAYERWVGAGAPALVFREPVACCAGVGVVHEPGCVHYKGRRSVR